MSALNVLIVFGYHPKETFATSVGEQLLKKNKNPGIIIREYQGDKDRKNSTYNLRRFISGFNPLLSPIILHGDDKPGFDAAFIYCARRKEDRKKAREPLLEFISGCDSGLVVFGRFLTPNTNYGLLDVELNSRMGLERAVKLVDDFSIFWLDLYKRGIGL